MPPKHYRQHHGGPSANNNNKENNGGGKNAPSAAKKSSPAAAAPAPSADLTASSPDELQAQMNRLLSEVDRVRSAMEQQRKASPPAPASPCDEDEEVLRLQYDNSAASASMDDDQPQPMKKPRGFSPTTTNAVAKAFGHAPPPETGTSEKRGGSPLMDQQAWLQKMLKQMPGGAQPPAASAPRSFQSPPPLPSGPKAGGPNPHDISALSSVPDASVLSEQDPMWAPNEQQHHHNNNNNNHGHGHGHHGHGMWQQQQQQQSIRGRGGAVYTNPRRTGAMSYRQNHHHDSLGGGGGRGGRGGFNNALFSDDGRGGYHNEYLTTKDYVIVEFKRERTKKYPCATKVQPGEYVIVDGDRGQDCGLVIQVAFAKDDGTFEVQCIDAMLKNYVRTKAERARVLRVATPEEVTFLHSDIDTMEKTALQTCKAKCDELGITDLKLVDCEFQFDRQKVSFFFDSERSIDFRALVRDLHRTFGIRIWMENINPGVKNSVPADAQADIMWTGEDTAQQRLVGGMGMGAGGSTMMMMSAGPAPHHSAGHGAGGSFRGAGGRGGGRGNMRR